MDKLLAVEKWAYDAAQAISLLSDDDDEQYAKVLNIYNEAIELASNIIRVELATSIYQCELKLRELTSQFMICVSNDGHMNIVYNLYSKKWDALKKEYDLRFETYEDNLEFLRTLC